MPSPQGWVHGVFWEAIPLGVLLKNSSPART